jgi:hypothetical protein
MLVVNIHQAGSITLELQQHMWMALQAVRARYPEAQGILGGDLCECTRGYSRGHESHMKQVDDQFQACVAAIKGTLVSPRTPSGIDVSTGKGERLDHLVGLEVEFACTSGAAAWVGSPFQDHGVLCSQHWYTETKDKKCEQSRVVPKDDDQAMARDQSPNR